MISKFENIAIYGGGSWGTALACQVARVQKQAKLFLRNPQIADEILTQHTNLAYLGNILLSENIYPSTNLNSVLDQEVIIIVVPSVEFSNALIHLKEADLSSEVVLLIATKGIANSPVQLLSAKAKSIFPDNPLAFISGPNFAREVASNQVTPATIAAEDTPLAEKLAVSLQSENFTITVTDDIITTQVAGAVKNIIAIKSGMYSALGYQDNARAGLITEGLKEITVIADVLGGRIDTILQPAVIGDLVLTCYSPASRNTKFGYELAIQKDRINFIKNYPYRVEGKEAAPLVLELVSKFNLKLPIISSIAEIVI